MLGQIDPSFRCYSRHQVNSIMISYAQLLSLNVTCKSIRIKLGTIKQYMSAASVFSAEIIKKPTFTEESIEHPLLTLLYAEQELYDSVMNKREPISEEMFNYIIGLKTLDDLHVNNAVADWLVIGRQAGLRLSEYGQDQVLLDREGTFQTNKFGDAKAFLLSDFTFYKQGGIAIPYSRDSRLDINDISAATITWRLQKNGEKDETIWYAKNEKDPSRCVIRAMIRIRDRALRLNIPHTHPIGVYSHEHKTCYITNTILRSHFQNAARTIHKITDPKKLQKYSSHSVRVMACVLLHTMGKDTSFIKHRLRWKSDAFTEYLRHVPISAQQHNEILQDCSFFL